jgi:hypothetical protein
LSRLKLTVNGAGLPLATSTCPRTDDEEEEEHEDNKNSSNTVARYDLTTAMNKRSMACLCHPIHSQAA